jgi:hypothetical protein
MDIPNPFNANPAFAGKTAEAYITTVKPTTRRPYPGYLVRIPDPRKERGFVTKSFCKLAGNMEALLLAAIGWRDTTYRELYGENPPRRAFHQKQVNSSTSIPGIRKTIKIVKKTLRNGITKNYEVPCLIAEISQQPGKNGKRSSKSLSKVYSLNKYTEDEALSLAIQWRQKQEALLKST